MLRVAVLLAALAGAASFAPVPRARPGTSATRLRAKRSFLRSDKDGDSGADETSFYRVTVSRATGIDWASDLSFRWVYVREVDAGSSAGLAGVQVGDQLVEVRAAAAAEPGDEEQADGDLLVGAGASFTEVTGALAALPASAQQVDLTFFRGSRKELKAVLAKAAAAAAAGDGGDEDGGAAAAAAAAAAMAEGAGPIKIRAVQGDKELAVMEVPAGSNLRDTLISNDINVYRSVTRWSNCSGKQLCGTCIVNVREGSGACSAKSLDEKSTLRENPETYRLSCVTFVYGDIEVEVLPPKVTAAQWTR